VQKAGEFSGTASRPSRSGAFVMRSKLVPSSKDGKHLSEGHVPRAQFKNSHCGCRTKNGTFVKPGRCPNCETSNFEKVSAWRTLCGLRISRGGPQRFDRCTTCNPARSSVSLKKTHYQLSMADAGGNPKKRKNAFLSGAVSDAIEGLASKCGTPHKRAVGKTQHVRT